MSNFVAAILAVCFMANGVTPHKDPNYAHKWGYVDTSGKEVIPAKYVSAGKFNHGYARCTGVNKLTGLSDYNTVIFVDKQGNEFKTNYVPPPEKLAQSTSIVIGDKTITQDTDFVVLSERKGLKLCRTSYNWYILNGKNKPLPILFNKFSPGGLNPRTGNWWFRRDKQTFEFTGNIGKCEMPGLEPSEPPPFVEEYVGIPTPLSNQYVYFGEFSEGLLAAWTKDKHWCYLDKDAKVQITLPDDCCAAHPFSEGLAAVAIGGKPWNEMGGHSRISSLNGAKFGFIDKTGKFVVPPIFPCPNFEWTSKFKNGLALATAEKNATFVFGYIDKTGKFVVPPKYSKLNEFSEGLAAFDSREPGFDKVAWSYRLRGGTESIKQFLRQYDLISMRKDDVVKLLGKPDSYSKNPESEMYLLSSGCFGSTWLAIRYDADGKVYGYAIPGGSYMPYQTNSVPPSQWIVTSQKPEIDEEYGAFFKRAEKVTFTPPYVSPTSNKYLQEIINSAFHSPVGQLPFDSDVWKSFPQKRKTMLYSFFHQRALNNRSIADCEKLLGKPDRTEKIAAPFSPQQMSAQYYDLRIPQYDRAELKISFTNGRLYAVGFSIENEKGIDFDLSTPWIKSNPSLEALASNINKYFGLVGLPPGVAHLQGFRTMETAPHWYQVPVPLDIRLTPDARQIEKLRINFEALGVSDRGKFSNWETTNYYPEPESNFPQHFYLEKQTDYHFMFPGMRFKDEHWKARELRDSQLFDVVNCKKLIGKTRAEIQAFLGAPDVVQGARGSNDKTRYVGKNSDDEMTSDCDWYGLSRTIQDSDTYLEIAYRDQVAVGYRLKHELKERQTKFQRKYETSTGLYADYSSVRKIIDPIILDARKKPRGD